MSVAGETDIEYFAACLQLLVGEAEKDGGRREEASTLRSGAAFALGFLHHCCDGWEGVPEHRARPRSRQCMSLRAQRTPRAG